MLQGIKLLLILSISFLLTGSLGGAINFYVESIDPPSDDPSCHCKRTSNSYYCETLDDYTKHLANTSDEILKNLDLSLIFLCGLHTLENSSTYTTNVNGLRHLTVQGNGSDPSQVIVEGIKLVIHRVSLLHLENVMLKDVSFQVYPSSIDDPVPFSISNCHFDHSHSLIVGSNLTVQDTLITDGINTAFNLIKSILTLKGNVTFFGNSGEKGGALGLTSTQLIISRDATVTFANNYAVSKGGAIYVNNPTEIFKVFPDSNCFYQLLDYNENASYSLTFMNNSAPSGGKHIFGAPLKGNCTAAIDTESHRNEVHSYIIVSKDVFRFDKPSLLNNSIDSAVSGSPARVCICNKSRVPLCSSSTEIFLSVSRYPGELFTLPAMLVGSDFGPTSGIVHSRLLTDNSKQQKTDAYLDTPSQLLHHSSCTKLNYTIFSATTGTKPALMQLRAIKSNLIWDPNENYRESINNSIDRYYNEGIIEGTLIFTPLFVNVTLKPCPSGFSLIEAGKCECYKPLEEHGLQCNSSGYMLLPDHEYYWIGAQSVDNKTEVILSKNFCPFCINSDSNLWINIQDEKSIASQCAFNRQDRLCGGCKKGYSLAIGSSSCIKCSNNNGLALLIFFAVAGLLLVLAVTILNFTVTQGMINGILFYANIVWIYEAVLFPQEHTHSLQFFRIFIAWLNLDFGIEMCFVKGLNAFWKSLLQYIFPLYICSIVAFIIWGARRSTRLTRLLGSKAVSVLSSLILLSYTKLLRNMYQSLNYASLLYYDNKTRVRTIIVWAEDGRLKYVASEHAVVFFIGLMAAVLCLVYTLVLLFGQWLRRLSFFSRFHPIFDSYFAPIRSKHHYMLGVLLITRVFLYFLNILLAVHDHVAIFILLITAVLLLSYMAAVRPLRSKYCFLFYVTFLINLIILSGSVLFVSSTTTDKKVESTKIAYITGVSTTVALLEFCGLIAYHVTKNVRSFICRMKYRRMKGDDEDFNEDQYHYEQKTNSTCVTFRDSILSEDSLTSEGSKPRALDRY